MEPKCADHANPIFPLSAAFDGTKSSTWSRRENFKRFITSPTYLNYHSRLEQNYIIPNYCNAGKPAGGCITGGEGIVPPVIFDQSV